MRLAMFLLAICMAWAVFSAEDISVEVTVYLKEHSNEAADQAWRDRMHAKFKEKLDRDEFFSSEQAVADDYLFNWLSDHHQAFEEDAAKRRKLTPDEKLEICRAYALYWDNGWELPRKVASEITRENFKRWIDNAKIEPIIATVRR